MSDNETNDERAPYGHCSGCGSSSEGATHQMGTVEHPNREPMVNPNFKRMKESEVDSATYQRLRRWLRDPLRRGCGGLWVVKAVPEGCEGLICEEEKVAAVLECGKRNGWMK